MFFFFFKQKTAYEMRISDWSSDVCSSDLCSGRLACKLVYGGTLCSVPGCSMRGAGGGPGGRAQSCRRRLSAIARDGLPPTQVEIGRASCRERVCQYV